MLSNWSKRQSRRQKRGILGLLWVSVFIILYFGQYLFIWGVVFATILTRVIVSPDRHKKLDPYIADKTTGIKIPRDEETLAEKRP